MKTNNILYKEAIRDALREEMLRDKSVFVIGLGVAKRGGSFGTSKGLYDIFGPDRLIDMPISESAYTGMAIGAAIQGKRPVMEIAFIDFATLSLDMMINQAAKYQFISAGKGAVPMVLRTQGGAGKGLAHQHSQSLEALFYHIPGLKVVVPSTPHDAKGLLKTAIRDDYPVVFIEHKLLYDTLGAVSEDEFTIPFGKAALRSEGSDCTIVSYSHMSTKCVEAASTLKENGIQCDVLDLRTLVPMDREAILKSVKKTGRLVIACEAVVRGSVASDISAWVTENAFQHLKCPIIRVAGKVTPIPYNEALEGVSVPNASDIVAAVTSLVKC